MKGKKLQLLATGLMVLAIFLVARPWRDSAMDTSDSNGASPTGDGAGGAAGGTRSETSASSRSPIARSAPFEASEEVAELLGEDHEHVVDVVARLKGFIEDSSKPMSARGEALTHLLNLCSPEDMERELLELALRPGLAREFRAEIIAESLNHSAEFRGELLISLLETPALGSEKEALEGLRELAGEDFGTSPAAWREALAR